MTEFFDWDSEKHSLWIAEMDRQHGAILSLMEDLSRRDAERAPSAELTQLLDLLSDYTIHHFKDEEAYMAATGYPKLDVHQVIHRDLLLKLQGHVSRFKAGNGRLGADLQSFLKFWLFAHVTGVDRQAGRHPLGQSAQWPETANEPGSAALQRKERSLLRR